jgi:hypothetical protein
MSPQPAWDPEYPTPGALAYRDGFIQGAAVGGLRDIPGAILSRAIDRAIERGATSRRAGMAFADVYFRIQMRREPRGGYGDAINYLMACFNRELEV